MTDPRPPRIVMTLLVRDEADIVARNVSWHLAQGVDHVIATDNGSTDGTVEELVPFVRDGVLTLLHERSRDYLQDVWTTRMALLARGELGANWVLCNDADEFWRSPTGRLHDVLPDPEDAPAMLVCQRHNMIAARDALCSTDWAGTLIYRADSPSPTPSLLAGDSGFRYVRMDRPYFQYRVPPKVLLPARDLRGVVRGAHSGTFNGVPPNRRACSVEIFHYPVRSLVEFERSVRQIGTAVRRRAGLRASVSWKYRRWLLMTEAAGSIWPAFREALPDRQRLAQDLRDGHVVEDRTMVRALRRLPANAAVPGGGDGGARRSACRTTH